MVSTRARHSSDNTQAQINRTVFLFIVRVIIIDVGINKDNDTICGDVDYNDVIDKVKSITPVPGGVGQMTVAELGKNILKAYNLQKHK